jgi:hypothetical protein
MSENYDNKPKRTEEHVNSITDQIKEVIEQGNMRRVIVRKQDNEQLFEVSLTAAVAVAAAILIFVPGGFFISLLAVIAGIFAKLRVEILRELRDDDEVVEGEIVNDANDA